MKDLTRLLQSSAFIPLCVGVVCDQQCHIKVTHTGHDIEKALLQLLDQVRSIAILLKSCWASFMFVLHKNRCWPL